MDIKIAKDFTRAPGSRYKADHAKPGHSGEEFRDELLIPRFNEAVAKGEQLVVNMDGVAGLPPSFIEEAFGGMIRKGISIDLVQKHLVLVSKEMPDSVEDAIEDMKAEAARQQARGGFTPRTEPSDPAPTEWDSPTN